jgi:levanase
MIYSGSAVLDWNNTSGFGSNSHPPLSRSTPEADTASKRKASPTAPTVARTRAKYQGSPVSDIYERTFCDPKFVWHAPRRQSVMIVALADLPYESRLFVDRRQAWFPHFPSAEAAGMQTGG